MKILPIVIMIAALFLNVSCDEFDVCNIYLYNNSNDTISVFGCQTFEEADTVTTKAAFKYYPDYFIKILPKETKETKVQVNTYAAGQFLIFKEQTFKEQTIDEIMNKDLCDKKIVIKISDLSEYDLETMKHVVEYNGK